MHDRFFVVIAHDDHRLCRHEGVHTATMEARRLAEVKKGTPFYVLEVIDGFVMPAPGPERVEFRQPLDREIPF